MRRAASNSTAASSVARPRVNPNAEGCQLPMRGRIQQVDIRFAPERKFLEDRPEIHRSIIATMGAWRHLPPDAPTSVARACAVEVSCQRNGPSVTHARHHQTRHCRPGRPFLPRLLAIA